MSVECVDPMLEIAEQVACCFADRGYAFIEDDHVEGLADALRSFLETAGIPVEVERPGAPGAAARQLKSYRRIGI